MTTLIIILMIYLISAYLQYRWVQLAFSKEGIFSGVKVESDSFFLVFTPILNTFGCIYGWFGWYPVKRRRDYSKFFNIKK